MKINTIELILLIYWFLSFIIGYYIWRRESKELDDWSWKQFRIGFFACFFFGWLLWPFAGIIELYERIRDKFPKEPPKWL